MSLYSLVIENKYLLEALYALTISLICGVIVLKTDKFFRLSLHQGIRYFRNAFLFYGLAFIGRYIFGVFNDLSIDYMYYTLKVVFEYLFIMAGFFLFYSLIWRRFESSKEEYTSSLFNRRIIIFHVLALVLAVLDGMWQTYYFMFISQIIVFFCAFVISIVNYKKDGRKHKFPKFYLAAMFLSLGVWVLNFLAESYLLWDKGLLLNIGIINIIFFLLFLYGVIRVTKSK